jgi:endonuclease-3
MTEARRELKRYPSIGEPGAERILLLAGARPVLGLESNAVRVLVRLAYGRDEAQWAKTYRVVQTAASAELPETIASRRLASLLLRHHGQTICRRNTPLCGDCPLTSECPTGRELFG